MAKLIFDGLTMQQAVVLSNWFEGQGEQDCTTSFEEAGIKSPVVNIMADGWKRINVVDQEVTLKLHTP